MSFDSTRITVHDYNLAIDFGKSIVFGQAFAFLPGNCLEHTSMAWVGSIFGAADFEKPRILSLLGEGPISMPGFDIEPLQLPSFKLASITCDKDVYEPQVDLVHLLIVYPDLAGARARLEVCLNGSVFLQPEVELGIDGTGQLTLSDLPVGEYSVCLESESESELSAKFLVSEFRLVPLVALLRERRRETSDRLSVALDLASYGEPVNGQVTVQVLESGVSVAVFKETAVKGRLNLSLKLEGEGQLVLNLQLVKDTSKTATVPLTGTRASERSQTLFSSLGLEVTGSLLPPDSDSKSVCVRGIYLESGAVVNPPLSLERVDADRARLK
ncbi:MAG: hypothetical protein K8F91_12890, partial [Candidatus Obscuribacterales bacterium]|nr:hypothetical protein [Candidatus Obscuribacterales bacterium]